MIYSSFAQERKSKFKSNVIITLSVAITGRCHLQRKRQTSFHAATRVNAFVVVTRRLN
jgi:hypothetical protein